MSTTFEVRGASPKQAAFLERLLAERGLAKDAIAGMTARAAIDHLLAMPRPAAAPAAAATPGYYVTADGTVFVVVRTKDGQRTYAKRLDIREGEGGRKSAAWVYAPGAGRNLAAEGLAPLTPAEAGRLGHLSGVCVICGRALVDPASVKAGIGPVCVRKLG